MTELLLAAVVLGVAGIDPAGFLVALGALAAGVRERIVVAFALIAVLGTVLIGTVLSVTVGQQLQEFDWASLVPPDGVAAGLELTIAAILLLWAVLRTRRGSGHTPRPKSRRSGTAILWVGALFAASAVLDPTFVGLVVLAGRTESIATVLLAHLVWIIISQVMLVAVAGAILAGRHARLVSWMQRLMLRARPALAKMGTATLLLAGSLLAVDSLWWIVTGRFLVGDPS